MYYLGSHTKLYDVSTSPNTLPILPAEGPPMEGTLEAGSDDPAAFAQVRAQMGTVSIDGVDLTCSNDETLKHLESLMRCIRGSIFLHGS